MKIAIIYDAIYPWVTGGAEKRIYELGLHLSSRGHEVHLFGIKWWEGNSIIKNEGLILHGVCNSRNLYVNGRRSILTALIFSIKLFFPLKREKFDLIDVNVFPYFSCLTAQLVSKINKTSLIHTWHEVWGQYWYTYMGKSGFFGKLIEKLVAKISPHNIVVSSWTKEKLMQLNVPDTKIVVIPNGVNFKDIFNDISNSKFEYLDFNLNEKKYDVIFVGRLIKEKNVDILIKSIYQLKKLSPFIRCVIVGEGPEKNTISNIINQLGISENIKLSGFLDYTDLICKIKTSKILVLPSSREGFGMVVIEAFACAVPVITVNEENNAAQSLVDNGTNGYVVDLDSKKISLSIGSMLENNSDYLRFSREAFKTAQSYDWDLICDKLEKYYKDCI